MSSAIDDGLAGSLRVKHLPFGFKPLQPSYAKAIYIPVWFIDGEVSGNVTKSGAEVREVELCDQGVVSLFSRYQR